MMHLAITFYLLGAAQTFVLLVQEPDPIRWPAALGTALLWPVLTLVVLVSHLRRVWQ